MYLLQAHRYRVLPGNLFNLPVELLDTLVKSLQVSPQSRARAGENVRSTVCGGLISRTFFLWASMGGASFSWQ